MPLQEVQNLTSSTQPKSGSQALKPVIQQQQMASSTAEALPVFDLAPFLALQEGEAPSAELLQQCAALSDCLARTGCLVVRDPRVAASDNDAFMDLLEHYFSRPLEHKMQDVRPQLSYQVGATPSGVEVPRCLAEPELCAAQVKQLPADAQPVMPSGPDVKWRYMWRVGPRPPNTQYAELNADPVVPKDLPGWSSLMDSWGNKLLAAVEAVSVMAALGFGLKDPNAFRQLMRGGPHLLAPTGSDLEQHGSKGTVLAGFHYDLNFITIHGRSRFPGLSVWLADGRKLPVSIPPGCLLCQAGKQLEWLTGGAVKAGMHEVVVGDATVAAVAAAKAAGRCCWRVSSTVFSHIASDELLQPLGHFAGSGGGGDYPPTPAGQQVREELKAIKLSQQSDAAVTLL